MNTDLVNPPRTARLRRAIARESELSAIRDGTCQASNRIVRIDRAELAAIREICECECFDEPPQQRANWVRVMDGFIAGLHEQRLDEQARLDALQHDLAAVQHGAQMIGES